MRRFLLGSAALLGAGMAANPAVAEDAIKLTVGGHFKEAYMVVEDDNDTDPEAPFGGDLGADHNRDGFFNDAEIDFTGSTVLDNGLEVGAQIELEGETQGHQIDEAYIWFAGGFGEVRIGADDEALHKACVVPPGGSSNFSAFSPNQWGANSGALMSIFSGMSDASICRGVDDDSDAQKIIYTSPIFAGFQLTASYTPNGNDEDHTDGVGPHLGMPTNVNGESRHNTSAAINYGYDGGDWGLTASLGGSWEGHVEVGGTPGIDEKIDNQDFYQAGINLYVGNFAIGIGGEYFYDLVGFHVDDLEDITADSWVAGIGASYSYDAWIFGAQYSHREDDHKVSGGGDTTKFDFQQDRVVGTVTYLFGPGMNFDASVGYTWLDSDPEFGQITETDDDLDDYQALEFGLGATIVF